MFFIWVCVKKGLTPCGFRYICNMDIEIITIGDELLIGQTVDTNSVYLAQVLAPLGLNISRKTAIRDDKKSIITALNESFSRVNLVIMTGGLGPTNDDITKSVLQEYYGCETRIDASVMQHLERIFANRSPELLAINKMQAILPDCSKTLFNSQGTAPGMWFEKEGRFLAAMPGVPGEVRAITEESLVPMLAPLFKLPPALHRTLSTALIPESLIAQKLQNFEANIRGCSLAYLPTHNVVKLRLTRKDPTLSLEVFERYWQYLIKELGDWIFCEQDFSMAEWLIQLAREKGLSISTAESCTGGYIGNQLVQISGASDVYLGTVVAYHNQIKSQLLGVDTAVIDTKGAVSAETAEQMVKGVCEKFNSDIGIATTGIAGPSGGTTDKPVGTIYIAVKYLEKITVKHYVLRGGRLDFMIRAMNTAMKQLKEMI
jgi:nicotinamide-nucleotide amidase